MRGIHKLLVFGAVTAVSVGMALGQGFPGRGGFGGGGNDPAALLRNPSVSKELKLTDEQIKKVPDAVWKALAEVLDPEQTKRLRQIVLQQRGAQAFTDAKVQTALKLTDEQKETIKSAIEDSAKETKDLFAEAKGGGGGFGAIGKKMGEIRKATMEKITGVLKTDQKKAWNELAGEEFKMEIGGFGKGKGGFKKKNKKDVDE